MLHYIELLKTLETETLPIIKNNKGVEYYNIECAFDIETTSLNNDGVKSAFMYVWQFGITNGSDTYYGRTWDELLDLLERISERLQLSEDRRLVIYIHNLSYEFQFMRKLFNWLDVFSLSERKPIRLLCDLGIEFRCSYVLSGYSLENTAKNLTTHKIKKLKGYLDYSLIRTYKTELTKLEIEYCVNDIQIILAYIKEQITFYKNITDIPMTNTGRVRKYVRDCCYYRNSDGSKANTGKRQKYYKIMNDLTLDLPTYKQLKRAFMGGFTHANSHYSGKLLEDVTSVDFTSSYPSVMLSEKFPMSRFKPIEITSVKHFEVLCIKYALIFDIKFEKVTSKINQENYISESKCMGLINPIINNGRVNSCDSMILTITEIDYEIMRNCYSWESISVSNVKYAHKNYLPKPIIKAVLDLYQGKTELKDVEGSEVEYLLSKGMLNSIYGMCVTDVVKEQTTYIDDEWGSSEPDTVDEIIKYNDSKNRFLYYPWGVWVTAYARRNLWTGIIAVGDDYIYSDTDSLKLLNYNEHTEYIKIFDDQIIKKMVDMCNYYKFDVNLLSPKTIKGVTKMIGIWDYEGTYTHFKTLGAKRYLSNDNGKLSLTVAGLSKKNGLEYMLKESDNDILKVFNLFDDNLQIPSNKTGKMTHTYLDEPQTLLVEDYKGTITKVNSFSSVHLENCEFSLSIADQYKTFLKNLSNGYIYKGVKNI